MLDNHAQYVILTAMNTREPLIAENRLFRDIPYALFCFALYLFIYGLLIFRFGMHQDEILDSEGQALGTYVGGGRWMVGIWRLLLPGGYLPFSSGLIAGVLISLTIVWQTKILGFVEKLPRLVYACFYLGCIQFAWMLYYSFLSDALAVGFLLSTGSVFFVQQRRWVLSTVCLTLALAVYQTNMLYVGVLFAAMLWRQPTKGGICVRFAVCAAGALVLWKAGVHVSYHLPWVSEGQIEYQQVYQEGMTQWHELKGRGVAFLIIFFGHYTLEAGKNLLGLTYDGQWVYATTLLPLLFLLWQTVKEEQGVVVKCRQLLLLFIVWTLPFVFPIIMGTVQGARTNLAEPLSCALLWTMALSRVDFNTGRRKACCYILLGMVVLKSSVQVSVMARDEMDAFRRAIAELRAMETCGLMLANCAGADIERVLLIGRVDKNNKPLRLQAQSLIFGDGSTTWYLNYLKSPFLAVAKDDDIAPHREVLEEMPAWPAPGSVRLHAGEVIIRITPNPAHPVPMRVWRERREKMRLLLSPDAGSSEA